MLKLLKIFQSLAEGASLNPGIYRLLALALFMLWCASPFTPPLFIAFAAETYHTHLA